MEKMTRRAMLWATSTGVATLAGAAALVANKQHQSVEAAAPTTTGVAATGSLTAYVANVNSGKMSLLINEREVIIDNPALVNQLLRHM